MSSDGIAYQNKDIASKVFAEKFGVKSLNVYGLQLPDIVRLEPTNLPTIQADELRVDALFLLEDGTLALVDYESGYEERDKIKYGKYLIRIAQRYMEKHGSVPVIRMIVIYTADVMPNQVKTEFDRGGIKIQITPAFLSELPSDEIKKKLTRKIENGEELADEDILELILLPLTYRTKEKKREMAKEAVMLALQIKDEDREIFALSGILVFSEKVIDSETSEKVREMLKMTKIQKLYEEEIGSKLIVSHVEHAVKKGLSLEDACDVIGVTVEDYYRSKRYVEEKAAS